MSELHEIMYLSRRAPGLTDAQVLDDIVLPSMRTNRQQDITGCLWFDAERFLQILEGPREAVLALYEKIVADPRHTDVKTLHDTAIPARSFSRWGMRAMGQTPGCTLADVLRQHAPEFASDGQDHTDEPATEGLITTVRNIMARFARTDSPSPIP